jgi:hypothetical protein
MRNLWYLHRLATVVVGGLSGLVLIAAVIVTVIGIHSHHPAAISSRPTSMSTTTTIPGGQKQSSELSSSYHPSYITPPATSTEQQFDAELAAEETQSVTAAAESLTVAAPAYSSAYPALDGSDNSSAITYADAFITELLNTRYGAQTRAALLAWAQAEAAANTLPGVPPAVAPKALYGSLADPTLGGIQGTTPLLSARAWSDAAAQQQTQKVMGIEASYDQSWSQLVTAGFVPLDPLMTTVDLSGTLTITWPHTVTSTVGPGKKTHTVQRKVSRIVEETRLEHFTVGLVLGSALHHPGYGVVAVDGWTVTG